MKRRVGILGGTFDPIHCGHLDLGAAVQRALELTSLLVVPANVPPHRPPPIASSLHRFAMVAMAVAGRAGWEASDLELLHDTPSYTAATLERLHERGLQPHELFFVIGADAFLEIRSWKNYPGILESARFAVVSRPGHAVDALPGQLPDLAPRMITESRDLIVDGQASIFLINAPTANVSSTAIRQRRLAGQSIAGLVPSGVQQHIEQHGLYTSMAAEQREPDRLTNMAAGRLHGQG